MNIAFVGCGFVADYYVSTLKNYPSLNLKGVYDINRSQQERFATFHSLTQYQSYEELLKDDTVDIVVNLTNPRS